MTRRYRCARGHFLPADFTPPATDPDDWDDECRCAIRKRRRRARSPLDSDLWGQGLTAIQRHTIRTVPIVGSYL
ncbi:hypothetical protein [Streptomyces rochei]|uniref:hypothetical protein n=1 Tax=Streptomyces rochei TaxID=1928 RepID=UPI0013B80D0A|nr:hypothetical protein [Streptomyces rochei]NEC77225.1 hypothetical protein [Streptomyces rochei]